MRPLRTATAVLAVATLACLAAAPAHAWLSQHDQTDASIAAYTPVTVDAVVPAAQLYPGKMLTATVDIANPNRFPVLVIGITAGSNPLIAHGGGECPAGTVASLGRTDAAGLVQDDGTRDIAAESTASYEVTVSMAAAPAGQIGVLNACIGLLFRLPVSVSVVAT